MNEVKKMWPYIRPYKIQAILIVILGLLMSGSQAGLAPIVKHLFDDVYVEKKSSLKVIYPLGIVAITLIFSVARYFHMFMLRYIGEKIIADIRSDLQSKFMTLNLSFHNNYKAGSGGLLSRILNDMVVVQWGFNIMADMIREPVTTLVLLAQLFILDWKLTLFLMIVAPITIVVLKQLARSIRKYVVKQQESMEQVTTILKETLDGLRIIQSFGLEREMSHRLKKVLDEFLSFRRKIIRREEVAGPVSELIGAMVIALIFIYMGDQILGGHGSLGTLMGFVAAIAQLNPSIKKIQDAYIRVQPTIASTQRLFEILEDKNEVPQESSHKPFPKQWESVRFENVSFSFGPRQILNNINLTVRRGEVVALVGASGSGKSTMVNLLERFFEPTQGRILIGDVPIHEIELNDLRKNIALVTQEVFLFDDSIERNIQAGDFDKLNGSVVEASETANAINFINETSHSFKTRVGDRGARLSGGERQRISIARAVFKDAPILILDEATSALDSTSEVEVQKGLDLLMKGRTAFVIAHRLSTVLNADRILVLQDGQIIEEGTHVSLIKQEGHYYNFYKLQALR